MRTPPIGVHNAYFWGTRYDQDLWKQVELAARAHMDVVEFSPARLAAKSAQERRELRAFAAGQGLKITCNGGMPDGCDLSSSDAQAQKAGIRFALQALEAAHDVEASSWSGVNYGAWLAKPACDAASAKKTAQDNAIRALREVLPLAEEYEIDYCFEVVNRYEQFMFNTAREALDFASRTGSPRAKLLLDVYHMNIDEDNLYDAIRLAAAQGRLGHMHVGEHNRRVPGTISTHIDWAQICRVLQQVRYEGVMTIESFVLPSSPIFQKTCTWEGCRSPEDIDGLVEDLRTGGAFLRQFFEQQRC